MVVRTISGSFAIISGTVSEVVNTLESEGVKNQNRIVGFALDSADAVVVMYRL